MPFLCCSGERRDPSQRQVLKQCRTAVVSPSAPGSLTHGTVNSHSAPGRLRGQKLGPPPLPRVPMVLTASSSHQQTRLLPEVGACSGGVKALSLPEHDVTCKAGVMGERGAPGITRASMLPLSSPPRPETECSLLSSMNSWKGNGSGDLPLAAPHTPTGHKAISEQAQRSCSVSRRHWHGAGS